MATQTTTTTEFVARNDGYIKPVPFDRERTFVPVIISDDSALRSEVDLQHLAALDKIPMILTTTYHYSNPETHYGGRQLPATGPEIVRYCVVPLMKLWDMEDRENFDVRYVNIEWGPFPKGANARKYMRKGAK
jgi:hypothetical protein